MNQHHSFRLTLVLLMTCGLSAYRLEAQQARCQPPVLAGANNTLNIFSPQQEIDLGDAMAEHLQRDFRVIEDGEATSYLRRVGERVVKQLPLSELRFQFFLYDQPIANAFALPGGRIYVSRKLVAFARGEDELAGILAHEVGRIVTHQGAADMTRLLRQVLGAREVGDRRDIFEKYNQLVENAARKLETVSRGEVVDERGRPDADQIAIYAMTSAGYDPQAFAAFWDRFADTKGKTGNWFSDLFGTTRPEARRLREILKGVASLPADCIAKRAAAPAGEFQRWQATVINYSGLGRKEALHAVLARKRLDPPLRGDITHLRFSPDGKYVLAQDDAGINILSREPFALLFRIDAPEARAAQWSPDSQSIVFYNEGLRVESWSVADEKLKSVHEMVVRKNCLQTRLSPDGKTLACLDWDYDLNLFDVASGEQVFQKKSFSEPPNYLNFFSLNLPAIEINAKFDLVQMAFSPDARYFVAANGESFVALDLNTRTPVSVGGAAKKLINGNFTFITPDRLAGSEWSRSSKSAVVTFPQGEVIDREIDFGMGDLAAPTRGNYVLLRPIHNFPVGVMDLATKKVVMANRQAAIDLYGDVFVSESTNGDIALYGVEKGDLRASVLLPRNPLGHVRAVALSPDFKWLAVSEQSRGAVWNLTTGERIFHVRGFRGAHFGEDGLLYADFPKFEKTERLIGKMSLASGEMSEGVRVTETLATQYGQFLLLKKPPATKNGLSPGKMTPIEGLLSLIAGSHLRADYTPPNIQMEMRDARTGATLWSRDFPKESPQVWVNPNEATMVMAWAVSASVAKAEIKKDTALSARLSAMKEKEGDYFLQTLDALTGQPTGALLIETGKGSFRIADAFVAGDWVVITDTNNRVLVYSLSTGEQKGKTFGSRPTVAKATGLLSVENERGQLTVYSLATMDKRQQFTFSSPVSLTQFSPDGKRLFVLTANQTTYLISLASSVP